MMRPMDYYYTDFTKIPFEISKEMHKKGNIIIGFVVKYSKYVFNKFFFVFRDKEEELLSVRSTYGF